MIANLYGDWVKGRDLSAYSLVQQKGIRLHREIDDYMDNHPSVRICMQSLYADLPKVTGIAMDLFFDHLLAKQWSKFHKVPFVDFLNDFYTAIPNFQQNYDPHFIQFLDRLKGYRWMHYYDKEEGLSKACQGVGSRISFPNELKHGLKVFRANRLLIEATFETYMQEAHQHFTHWHQSAD